MGNINLITIFATGLITGGLTCMAVQGGLLAATLAQRSSFAKATVDKEEELKNRLKNGAALPILSFLVAKLVAYTLLGLLLGWLGSFFKLSLSLQVILQIVVVVFMLGTALNILNVHPLFRYFVLQPPHFLTRLIRKQSKRNDIFSPALLGFLTVFIPCGTTQAMMALAVISGNAFLGGAILFAFVLGTTPIFFVLGYLATRLGSALQARFMKTAAFAIILLSLFNLNNALALSGSNVTLSSVAQNVYCTFSICSAEAALGANDSNPVSEATIFIQNNGYSPDHFSVRTGTEVTLHLNNTSGSGCTQAFTIPRLGIQKVVPVGSSDTITFTAPENPGTIAFMCSMGMYKGTIEVRS